MGTRGLRAYAIAIWGVLSLHMALDVIEPHIFTTVDSDHVLYLSLPGWLRVALWAGFGIVALVAAITKRSGFITAAGAALAFMPAERAVSFLWAAYMEQSVSMLSLSVFWSMLMCLVLVTVRIPDVPHRKIMKGKG